MTKKLTNFLDSNDAIFHYTKRETAMEYILNNKTLKFGLLKNTNDPYEYKKKSIITCTVESEKEKEKDFKNNSIEDIIQNTLFLSFSTNLIDDSNLIRKGYEKSRMWSQYGENHEGICLVFSKESLLEIIKKELSENYIIYYEKINYEITHLEPSIGEQPIEYIENSYRNIFFQKHIDYKDESEFRIVLVQKNEKNTYKDLFVDISNSLKLIILGDNFPKVYLPTIKNLSLELNVEHKKLLWEDNQYYQVNPLA